MVGRGENKSPRESVYMRMSPATLRRAAGVCVFTFVFAVSPGAQERQAPGFEPHFACASTSSIACLNAPYGCAP